jgi:Pyruvate/2-oxoacid:ferredoxin oxidoreductase delta subunit
MGVDPLSVPFIRIADEIRLGNANTAKIQLLGEPLEKCVCPDLDVPASPLGQNMPRFLIRIAKDLIISKPIIEAETCSRCGQCTEAWPTDTKSLRRKAGEGPCGLPHYLYLTCIRCYCCQETCATGAIRIRHAPLAGMFESRR